MNTPIKKLLTFLLLCTVFLSLLCVPTPVKADAEPWQSLEPGPGGNPIYTITVDQENPMIVYAGTPNGVYKSTDGGEQWINSSNNMRTSFNDIPSIDVITIHPQSNNIVYASSSYSWGLFKSSDGGQNWTKINEGVTFPYVKTILINPQNPSTMFVSTLNYSGKGGIYLSNDGGDTWTPSNTGLPTPASVYSIVMHPTNPNIIFAAVPGSGIYRSINGGATWTAINTSATINFTNILLIDPTTPTTIYAGTANNGVCKSIDSGTTFSPINDGISTDNHITSLWMATPTTIYVGTEEGGLFKSLDAGTSWELLNEGLHSNYIQSIAGVKNDSLVIYTGSMAGLYKSTDSGDTWGEYNNGFPPAKSYALLLLPSNPKSLIAGTVGGGVYKYQDNNWVSNSSGLSNTWIRSLAYDSITPSTLYCGTFFGGVYKSIDGGSSWEEINNGIPSYGNDVREIVINPNIPSTIYLGLQAGVYKSTDYGSSWFSSSIGLPSNSRNINSLAIDQNNPEILYAGVGSEGIYKSINGGESWELVVEGESTFNHTHMLAVDPNNSSIVYAGAQGNMYRSIDSGATWTPTNLENNVMTMTFNSILEDTLYAGTEGTGVYKSTDNGITWEPMMDDSFPRFDTYVYDLKFDPDSEKLYAAMNLGVFVKNEALPEISLSQTFTPKSAKPGDTVTITITFENTGKSTAENISITDFVNANILNTNLSYTGVTPTEIDGWRYVWNMPSLAPGQGGEITITGTLAIPLAVGEINNHVSLTATSILEETEETITIENVAPIAYAGNNIEVVINNLVTLNGSGTDDNGDSFTYHWEQISGPAVTLSDPNMVNPTFTSPDEDCELIFSLCVTDQHGLESATVDEVVVRVVEMYYIHLPLTVR